MPEEVNERALKELDRLEKMPYAAPEGSVVRTYLDWLISLPWAKATHESLDIDDAAKVLDQDHYGLVKVKERVLEFLAVRKLAGTMKGPILCFVGPPGVGKTSIGKSIARALGTEVHQNLPRRLRDEAEIRGHRRTYVGALPGRIIQGIKQAGSEPRLYARRDRQGRCRISEETRRRRCSKRSTPSRTRCSATITWRCRSTCPT